MFLSTPAIARLRVLRLLWLLSTLFSSLPLATAAQDSPGPEKQAQYRSLIEKALQEYALGHWPEARVFFSDAHALWPNARTLRGLGMTCYEERSYVEAIGFLEQALESKTQPLTPKLAGEAQNLLAQAKRFVSNAYFELKPAKALLRIDDQPAKLRPNGAVLLDPGDHSVEIASSGFETERRSVHAEAGRTLQLEIALRRSGASQPTAAEAPLTLAPPLQPEPPRTTPLAAAGRPTREGFASQSGTAAAALATLGLAGLATGWVFYGLRDQLRLELWALSLDKTQNFQQSKYHDFQTRGSIAIAAGSLGALFMSLAQYFWLPDEEPVPAWAWVVGGVGGAIALGAVAWAAFGKHCELSDSLAFCRSTFSDPLFAPVLAVQALPLLSLPIMYAIRPRMPVQDAHFTFGVGNLAAHSVSVNIAGRF